MIIGKKIVKLEDFTESILPAYNTNTDSVFKNTF